MALTFDFVTAATVNYLPQALVTIRSARRQGVASRFFFFAVDAPPSTVAALREILNDEYWIEIFGPHDLDVGRESFLRAFAYFSPIEICCLAKYVGISHVLSLPGSSDYCVFADADVMFFSGLREPLGALSDVALLITPHQLGPCNDSVEHEYLQSGWINAGFLSVRKCDQNTPRILEWLVDRITRRGFFAPALGLYCDQSWLSLLPLVFRRQVALCDHPGMNVAYWNVSERKLEIQGGRLLVNGKPLIFFHFSGFDKLRRNRLSKHSDVTFMLGSVLADICEQYQAELSGVEHLAPTLTGLQTIPSSSDSLQGRIETGSKIYRTDIASPGATRGVFARIGGKIDSALCRLIGR